MRRDFRSASISIGNFSRGRTADATLASAGARVFDRTMLDDSSRLRDFPSLAGVAYLNTAAESIPPRATGEAIEAYWRDKLRGMNGRDGHFAQVEECREVSARFLGLQPAEVSFCSCSWGGYTLLASAVQLGADDEGIVTDLDFPAGVTPWLRAV